MSLEKLIGSGNVPHASIILWHMSLTIKNENYIKKIIYIYINEGAWLEHYIYIILFI